MPELLKGKCQRHKVRQCHRRHTQEYANKDDADMITVDTASIDCASLEGGTNYDSQWPSGSAKPARAARTTTWRPLRASRNVDRWARVGRLSGAASTQVSSSKGMRLRGGRTVCDVEEVLAGQIAALGAQPKPAEPEAPGFWDGYTFWDAQNNGWANAEAGAFECMMDGCAHVFPGRDGGRWGGLAEGHEVPFKLGRMCERCWPRCGRSDHGRGPCAWHVTHCTRARSYNLWGLSEYDDRCESLALN